MTKAKNDIDNCLDKNMHNSDFGSIEKMCNQHVEVLLSNMLTSVPIGHDFILIQY